MAMTMTQSNMANTQAADCAAPHPAPKTKQLNQVIAELVSNGSIELSAHDDRDIGETTNLLPFGASVYLPAPPSRPLLANIERMRALHEAGYDPVPHIAARRIPSRRQLEEFLAKVVQDCGVHRVLLIGGDLAEPVGPYVDSAALLRDDILTRAGISEVGFAGYPEGHPHIPSSRLTDALEEKLALAAESGLGAYVITQFSFAPMRIVNYCATLAHRSPTVSIYVGVAGPTNPVKLMRYARRCGVSASLRALSDLGFKAAQLVVHTEPNEQLIALAHYCAVHAAGNVVGVHVFSFGGFLESAKWMNRNYTEQPSP